MPSKKIFVVLIICLSIVFSIFIFQKNTQIETKTVKNDGVVALNPREEVKLGYDWKKILTDTSKTTTSILSKTNISEENTMTDDVAKSFFSQYLILKKDGKQITSDDALTIAKNTISSPEYANLTGAQYNSQNIHINSAVNQDIVQNYYNSLGKVSGIWLTHQISEEFFITTKALTDKNESELKKLDPIIADYKKIISLLLDMSVPSDAVQIHLDLLNSTSNVLFSIESMRVSFSDPVKGLLGMDRYEIYMENLGKSIKKVDMYFASKGL